MTRHSDSSKIEADLRHSRDALSATLEALQDRFAGSGLAQEAMSLIANNAGTYGRSIGRAARANPVPFALAGAALGWFAFGPRRHAPEPDAAILDEMTEAAAEIPADAQELWARNVDRLRERASRALRRIERDARDHLSDVRDGIASRYEDARDFTAERAEIIATFTRDLNDSFHDGLDDLTDAARERVVAARERAYAAGASAERAMKSGAKEAGRMFEDHPLVAGALAIGIGATLAAALPRRAPRRPAPSDRAAMMAEAMEVVREERARAARIARGFGEDLRASAEDFANSLAQNAADAGETLRNRATTTRRGLFRHR